MIPGRVIAYILLEEFLDVGEFLGVIPEREVRDEPLPIGPDVVVFGVEGEHGGEEGTFGLGDRRVLGDQELAVVPVSR